jgi:hypothetical protein
LRECGNSRRVALSDCEESGCSKTSDDGVDAVSLDPEET